MAGIDRDELIAANRARSQELRAGTHSWREDSGRGSTRPVVKVLRRAYRATIFIAFVVALVAVGTPRSEFVKLFLLLGAGVVIWWVIPVFIQRGLPLFLRGRPDCEVDRIVTRVGVASWVTIFVVAPVVANVFFGADIPIQYQELFLVIGALAAIVWLVGRLRKPAVEPPEPDARPRVDGLLPGVTLIARPIAWAINRREAKRRG